MAPYRLRLYYVQDGGSRSHPPPHLPPPSPWHIEIEEQIIIVCRKYEKVEFHFPTLCSSAKFYSAPLLRSILGHHIGRGEIFVSGMDGRRERVEPGISGDIHFLLLRIPQYVRSI